jgi:hypothetical protein
VLAGEILGTKQPHVSLLMRNRSGNFSVERLMDFLTGLLSFSSAFPRADISTRNPMKICGAVARMALARAARSIEPVDQSKPMNGLIRNVRA